VPEFRAPAYNSGLELWFKSVFLRRVDTHAAEHPQELLATFLDQGSTEATIEGVAVTTSADAITCPWWTVSRRILRSEQFAIAAIRAGYVAADVNHARVLVASDFAG